MRSRLLWLTCATCACVSLAAGASGQTLTFASAASTAPAGARGGVSVDLNRDGWADIATANTGRNTVAIFINRGAQGGFLPPREIPVGRGPFEIATGDFNRDGVPDLVVAAPDAPAIELLLMRADATLRSRTAISPVESRGVAVADVTRDGAVDVIFTDYVLNRVVVLPGTGSGGFRAPLSWAVGSRPQGVAVGDFNHDGFIDIAAAATNATSLTILSGTASGSMTSRSVAAARTLNVLTALDVNADGWLDLAAASTSTNVVSFFKGSATGFTLAGTRATGSSPRGIIAGDFNHDARPDLAVGNRGSSSVTVLLARRDGSVLPDRWGDLPAGSGARAVVAADFDNDGRHDFASAAELSPILTTFSNDTAFVRAGFSFRRQKLAGFQTRQTVAAADFNENGKPDLLDTIDNVLLDDGRKVRLVEDGGLPVMDVASTDFDRDGHADAIIAWRSFDEVGQSLSGEVDIFRGDGTGRFTLLTRIGNLPNVWRVRVADLNRDGRPDLVVQGEREIWVGLQASSGAVQVTTIPIDIVVTHLEIADMNRDGITDVVTLEATGEGDSVNVRLGTAAGALGAPIVAASNVGATQLVIGDLNHDGRPDIVTDGGGEVGVILAAGDASWLPQVRYEAFNFSDAPTGVTLGDFTHDGHLDVFTWTGALLTGRGDGTFNPFDGFAVQPFSGVALDWNGDGLLDFVTPWEAILNERRAQNRRPVANAGPDRTFMFHEQFEQGDGVISGEASFDPDLHQLAYEWRDETGAVFERQSRPIFPVKPPGTYPFTLTVRDGRGGEASDTVLITIVRDEEIVLHTDTALVVGHDWVQFQDEGLGAASDTVVFSLNNGAPKAAAPSANPASYVEFSFIPDPTLTYKLWVRLKADRDHWSNDSIWVQFSDALDAGGRPIHRIGSTQGLSVNLEECSNCGVSGWGWEDDGWGAVNRNGTLLRFAERSDFPAQRIRIQVREDGVSVDQIVLSAVKYRTTRPGTAKNDTTILPKTQR